MTSGVINSTPCELVFGPLSNALFGRLFGPGANVTNSLSSVMSSSILACTDAIASDAAAAATADAFGIRRGFNIADGLTLGLRVAIFSFG